MCKFIALPVVLFFLFGFTFQQKEGKPGETANADSLGRGKKKVTGVGGIFFKTKDRVAIKAWYSKHLGFITDEYGSLFEFRNSDDPETKNYLQWAPFSEKTKYFNPSKKDFMINFRVENIEELVAELKLNGVTVLDTISAYEYGKFVHILDPDSNKIELWEPVDNEFTRTYKGKTMK